MSARKPSRPQRPRLEVSQTSNVFAVFDDRGFNEKVVLCDVRSGSREEVYLSAKDVTRTRKFLEKCEEYLESQRSEKRYDAYLSRKRAARKERK